MSSNNKTIPTSMPPWLAILLTLAMVVIVRELCVLVCHNLGIPRAANIVGLVVMFILLFTWRWFREKQQTLNTPSLPNWLTNASNRLLLDSGLAFLPISAGAGLLLFSLGDELWGVLTVIFVSTLIPLWGIAKLSNYWLNKSSTTNNAQSKGGN